MSKFNAFMHNKVQLFVPELGDGLLAALENSGAPLMFRVSKGYTYDAQPNDDGSTSAEVAHVLFPIAGRVYEVAAPVTAAIAERAAEWPEWAADECEVSHRLDTDLDSYADEYASYVGEARELYTSMSAWADERGYFPPMLASISVAADSEHDGTQFPGGQLYQDLERFAEVPSYAEAELDEGCGVTRIDTVSSNGGFAAPVRYVTNRAKNAELEERAGSSSAPTVAEYNGYIAKTHDTITNGKYEFWSGWDHWLDQHIGLKYVGDEPCGRTNSLNGNLSASGPPIGQRTTADYGSEKATHWYTGYPGLGLVGVLGHRLRLRLLQQRRRRVRVRRFEQRQVLPRGHGPQLLVVRPRRVACTSDRARRRRRGRDGARRPGFCFSFVAGVASRSAG